MMAKCSMFIILIAGLPTPQGTGAETDFVLIEAEQPREGRVLISETPLDHTSFNVASVRQRGGGAADASVPSAILRQNKGRWYTLLQMLSTPSAILGKCGGRW